MRKQILAYAVKYQGEYRKIKQAIEKNEEWQECAYEGNYVTILDEQYPTCFYELEEPPFILFYVGDWTLLSKRKICVVGSREPSEYGKAMCNILASHLSKDCIIVSGLAKGIDASIHAAAIRCHLSTIGVLGCGLDVVYPKSNHYLYETMARNHCILSEYPFGTAPLSHHFPWRNRLLAALGEKCVVVEAKKKSGTMITVGFALKLNRDIFAFPSRFGDPCGIGSNELIQQGANILIEPYDLQNL